MSRKRSTPLADESLPPGHCSSEVRAAILAQAPYFRSLAPAALAAVNARFRERNFEAGSVICREGEPARSLFFVAHGKVKLLRHSRGGEDVMLDLLSQGDLFGGLLPLGRRRYGESAVAQTDCCLLAISAEEFQALLAQAPEVTLAVLEQVGEDLDGAREHIRQLTTSTVEIRLATLLLHLARRLGQADAGGRLIQAPLPNQDLAAMVGATQETVSRVMAGFRRRGLVESGRQWVRILDAAALAELAGVVEGID